MLKKYKDIKVGEYFEDEEGYVFVKCESYNEVTSKYEYVGVDVESGAEFYFVDDAECSVIDWNKECVD